MERRVTADQTPVPGRIVAAQGRLFVARHDLGDGPRFQRAPDGVPGITLAPAANQQAANRAHV
jgi:hypothetical protein